MAPLDPRPNAETVELYTQLPSEALMVLRTMFEHDARRQDLSIGARRFIVNRLALIEHIITIRTEYPDG